MTELLAAAYGNMETLSSKQWQFCNARPAARRRHIVRFCHSVTSEECSVKLFNSTRKTYRSDTNAELCSTYRDQVNLDQDKPECTVNSQPVNYAHSMKGISPLLALQGR